MPARRTLPPPTLLRQLLEYDPIYGRLIWLPRDETTIAEGGGTSRDAKSWNGKYAGKFADTALCANGYRRVCIYDKRFSAHRVAWAVAYGLWPVHEIDHINHIKTDNRLENIRDVRHAVNARNQPLRADNKSGLVGIWEQKPKAWGARWAVVASGVVDGRSQIFGKKAFKCLGKAVAYRNACYRDRGFEATHGKKRAANEAQP